MVVIIPVKAYLVYLLIWLLLCSLVISCVLSDYLFILLLSCQTQVCLFYSKCVPYSNRVFFFCAAYLIMVALVCSYTAIYCEQKQLQANYAQRMNNLKAHKASSSLAEDKLAAWETTWRPCVNCSEILGQKVGYSSNK